MVRRSHKDEMQRYSRVMDGFLQPTSSILRDSKHRYNEPFVEFTFTKFGGSQVMVLLVQSRPQKSIYRSVSHFALAGNDFQGAEGGHCNRPHCSRLVSSDHKENAHVKGNYFRVDVRGTTCRHNIGPPRPVSF
jgi:hypothetical protein